MEVTDVLKLLSDHPAGSFLELSPFNERTFGSCDFTGVHPGWEMHPDTDEFFYVLSGRLEIALLEDGGPAHYVAPAGSSFVVPRGVWHKPGAPEGAKFLFFTPGRSLYSQSEDPRLDRDGGEDDQLLQAGAGVAAHDGRERKDSSWPPSSH